MMHLRKKLVALGATVAIVACCQSSFAQDDLDDLLRDLESEAASEPETADVEEVAPDAEIAVVPTVEEAASAEEEAVEPASDEEAADDGEVAAEEPTEEPAAETVEEPEVEPAEEPVVEPAEEPEVETADDSEVASEEPAEEPVAETVEEPEVEPAEEPEVEPAEQPAEEPSVEPAEEPSVEPAEVETPADVEEGEEPAVASAEEPVAEEEPAAKPQSLLYEIEPVADGEAEVDDLEKELDSLLDSDIAPVAAEEPAPAVEEPAPVAEEPAPVAEEPEDAEEEPTETTEEPKKAETAKEVYSEDDELLANIIATEKIRREAYDQQARREIEEARVKMQNGDFVGASRNYKNAINLLTDNVANAPLRKECRQGIAESLYRLALQEYAGGVREKAREHMRQANELRHPKAAKVLETWLAAGDPDANKTEVSEVASRRNDKEYIDRRAENLQHLKRSRQYLGTRELDKALDECELVLVNDPYNETALGIRKMIQKKRRAILKKEREATREGMIADVDKAWRPAYAVNALEVKDEANKTVRIGDDDPSRVQEEQIIKSMKEMRIPLIEFEPPNTIADAIDFFRIASRDYGRPEIPPEERMINFVLKTGDTLVATQQTEEAASGFSAGGGDEGGGETYGLPVIPKMSTTNLTLYEALKLVCDQCDYKFKVQPPVVMIMPKDATIDELVTRSYPVVAEFMTRMESASSDVKDMRAAGFGASNNLNRRQNSDDSDENQQQAWKDFFSLLGVNWPEGSQIMYLKTLGKLRVKNTYENLAELEKALVELNVNPRLIEIEARFVEVCQEDLNSLGFEWILNSDYSVGLGKHVSRALGIRGGAWGERSAASTTTSTGSDTSSAIGSISGLGNPVSTGGAASSAAGTTLLHNSSGATWVRNGSSSHGGLGINATGGTGSEYATNLRYLSTDSNHISGEGYSNNDQFMRVNAYLGTADLSMILHMLSQRSDTDLLSAPKVLTRNGEQAIIKVVTEYIYPTDYDVQLQSSTNGGSPSGGGSQSAILAIVEPQNFSMREVGVILDVTPTLTAESNLIDLKLDTRVVDEPTWKNYGMRIPFTGNARSGDITFPDAPLEGAELPEATVTKILGAWASVCEAIADSLTGTQNITYYDAPMEQPFFHVRSIETSVSVYPGATIVMGGLITEQRKAMDDKIPFLGDLPFVGRLFRSHSEQTKKRNLLIFLTTRLVDVRGREIVLEESEQKDSDFKAAPVDED